MPKHPEKSEHKAKGMTDEFLKKKARGIKKGLDKKASKGESDFLFKSSHED